MATTSKAANYIGSFVGVLTATVAYRYFIIEPEIEGRIDEAVAKSVKIANRDGRGTAYSDVYNNLGEYAEVKDGKVVPNSKLFDKTLVEGDEHYLAYTPEGTKIPARFAKI